MKFSQKGIVEYQWIWVAGPYNWTGGLPTRFTGKILTRREYWKWRTTELLYHQRWLEQRWNLPVCSRQEPSFLLHLWCLGNSWATQKWLFSRFGTVDEPLLWLVSWWHLRKPWPRKMQWMMNCVGLKCLLDHGRLDDINAPRLA